MRKGTTMPDSPGESPTLSRAVFARALAAAAAVAGVPRRADAQAGPVTIRAAITSVYYDAVPILYAQRTGMFTKAGIDLQLGRLGTGAAVTAAVAGGSLDIGKSSFSPVVSAFGHGIPITLIAPGAIYDAKSPNGALVVPRESPIRGAADMNGKIVAVNNLTDPTRPGIDQWLEQNGQSKDAVKLVEVPMSAMMGALEGGRVDAIMLTSPVMDEALASGKVRSLAPVMSAIAPRWLFSAYFATKEWAAKNRATVKRFADVMVASAAYTNAHHGEMTALIAELVGATESSIARMTWPTGGTVLLPAEIQPVIDIAAKYGMIAKRFEAREMIFDPNKA
jgi:NitT/TauT family transport system substrate-binding protein